MYAIVRAGGENAQVIHIFVKDEIVHRRELVQVSFRWSFELDVRSQLNLLRAIPRQLPNLSAQRSKSPYRRNETARLTPRRSARQQLEIRNSGLLRKTGAAGINRIARRRRDLIIAGIVALFAPGSKTKKDVA